MQVHHRQANEKIYSLEYEYQVYIGIVMLQPNVNVHLIHVQAANYYKCKHVNHCKAII